MLCAYTSHGAHRYLKLFLLQGFAMPTPTPESHSVQGRFSSNNPTYLKRHRSLHPSLVITIVDILRLRTQQIITHSQTQILLLLLMHREFLHLRMLVELPHSTGLSTPTTTKLIYLSMRHGKTKTIMNFPLHKRLPAHPRW